MSNLALDLAAAATRLNSARARPQERRRFRRLNLVVGGRMLDPSGREDDCRTADMSPGDVRLVAPVLPNVGERVVLYLEGFGRLSGHVARRGDQDVAVIFDFSAHKREKLTEQLTLAINKDLGIVAEERRAPRLRETGPAPLARVETETGEAYEGEVLDFSLAGVTLRTQRAPPLIGTWVRVGGAYGRVARLIEGGFAVDFEPRARPKG
jgi:hypothetical protein